MQKRCFSPRISSWLRTGTVVAMMRSPMLFSERNLNPSEIAATMITPSSRGAYSLPSATVGEA